MAPNIVTADYTPQKLVSIIRLNINKNIFKSIITRKTSYYTKKVKKTIITRFTYWHVIMLCYPSSSFTKNSKWQTFIHKYSKLIFPFQFNLIQVLTNNVTFYTMTVSTIHNAKYFTNWVKDIDTSTLRVSIDLDVAQ